MPAIQLGTEQGETKPFCRALGGHTGTTLRGVIQSTASLPLPHVLKLRWAILKVRGNRFHLMWFANQGEDDLAFGGKVFGSTGK
jgi:hypothetical protein